MTNASFSQTQRRVRLAPARLWRSARCYSYRHINLAQIMKLILMTVINFLWNSKIFKYNYHSWLSKRISWPINLINNTTRNKSFFQQFFLKPLLNIWQSILDIVSSISTVLIIEQCYFQTMFVLFVKLVKKVLSYQNFWPNDFWS